MRIKNLKQTAYSIAALIVLSSVLFMGCNNQYKYPGYKLLEKRFVKEVNADCYYFEHI